MKFDLVEFTSSETHFLFNPRTPALEIQDIKSRLQALKPIEAHVWVATSGSTAQVSGQLKWVALSKKAVLASAASVNRHLRVGPQDVWVHCLPVFHVGGMGIFARAHLSGTCVVDGLYSNGSERKWDARHFYEVCEKNNGTLSAVVPAQVFDLVHLGLKAPRQMRGIVVGGAALTEELYLQARALGWPLLPSYGMTETCSQIATASLESLASEKMPFPLLLSHADVRSGPDGKLQVRSPSLLTGFATLSIDGDRWFDPKQGDWFQSEDRLELIAVSNGTELKVLGRDHDFIKIGGESVDLSRLNAILTAARSDAKTDLDVALINVADSRLGHVIHGVAAAPAENFEAQKVFELFNSRVLPFERTRKIHFVSSIPRSPLKKLLKAELLALLGF
jgi:O-succinylbenzoic acid--CoA ligase